jgi:hypothetical protein
MKPEGLTVVPFHLLVVQRLPSLKLAAPTFGSITRILAPVAVSANRTEGVITIEGGGEVDVWTLDHERAGRGRRYHLALIDEGAWGRR